MEYLYNAIAELNERIAVEVVAKHKIAYEKQQLEMELNQLKQQLKEQEVDDSVSNS